MTLADDQPPLLTFTHPSSSSHPHSQSQPISSSHLSLTPDRSSKFSSPDLPDPSQTGPHFNQMLAFKSHSSLGPHSSLNSSPLPHAPVASAQPDSHKKHHSALDLPFTITSLTNDFARHSLHLTEPQPDKARLLSDDPRSDSDSTTTSHQQRSSIGASSVNGCDLPAPQPDLDLPTQPASEDIFLEQEPPSPLELITDPQPVTLHYPEPTFSPPSPNNHLPTLQLQPLRTSQDPNIIPVVDDVFYQPSSEQTELIKTSFDSINVLGASARMTEVGMMIQEVALALFEVQELRHSSAFNNDSTRPQVRHPIDASPSVLAGAKFRQTITQDGSSSSRLAGTSALTPVDRALMKLDKKVEETSSEIGHLEELIKPFQGAEKAAEVDFLNQKYDGLMKDWTKIQKDTELLRDELKEDKWLVVFRTVSAQAEEMMGSLEKALAASQEFISDLNTRRRRSDLYISHHVGSERRRGKSSSDSLEATPLKLELEAVQELLDRYLALRKNFVAKKKHYSPSCERVLSTLVKGIENRSTKNGEVLRRYADMRTRFNHIQQRISRMDAELSRAEDLLRQTIELDGQSVSDQAADTSVSVISQTQTPSHKTSMRTMKSSSTTNSTRTSRALNSVTQYLNPSSSQFLTKHSFKKLASKISPGKTQPHTPVVAPSTTSNHSVGPQSSLAQSSHRPPHLSYSHSTSRDLRHKRSVLQPSGISPSVSATHHRSSSAVAEPSVYTPHNLIRANSNTHHRSVPITKAEKPRWNISLKRMEDSPEPFDGSLRRAHLTPSVTGGRGPSRCASSLAHAGGWTPVPSASKGSRLSGVSDAPPRGHYPRPASAAGRSDCSGVTTMSMTYRPRPPSRTSRIPAPMTARRTAEGDPETSMSRLPRPPSRAVTPGLHGSRLPRASRCATPSGGRAYSSMPSAMLTPSSVTSGYGSLRFSPTSSDIAKLPKVPNNNNDRRQSNDTQGLGITSSSALEGGRGGQKRYDCNPFDPLDRKVWSIVNEQMVEIGLKRIDPPLSRNAEKVKSAGGGIGDQARYRFKFGSGGGGGYEKESKSMMCKLVLKHRGVGGGGQGTESMERVVVRVGGGWQELEMYLLDEQERMLRQP